MAKLTTDKRNALRKNQFADPENRAYPIADKSHSDSSMARLEQQKGAMSDGKYRTLKRRIRAAQRRFGDAPKGTSIVGTQPSGARGFRIRMTAPDGSHTVIHHSLNSSFSGVLLLPAIPLSGLDDI